MCNTPLPVFYVTIILLKYNFFSLCLNFLGVFFFLQTPSDSNALLTTNRQQNGGK